MVGRSFIHVALTSALFFHHVGLFYSFTQCKPSQITAHNELNNVGQGTLRLSAPQRFLPSTMPLLGSRNSTLSSSVGNAQRRPGERLLTFEQVSRPIRSFRTLRGLSNQGNKGVSDPT